MLITEKNIEEQMKESFEKNSNWLIVYKELKEVCDKQKSHNNYHALGDNFDEIFIYQMVKNKVNLEQFSKVIDDIYKNNTHFKIGNTLTRFFNRTDYDIGLKEYSKLDKYNNDESIYDQMGYLFLDWNKENKRGKQVILDKDNLPYLLAILNEAKDENVGALWYGGFHCFLDYFSHHIEAIKPLIDMAINNPALAKCERGEYMGFMDNLLRNLGHNSYEDQLYKNESVDLYQSLSKIVPNINDYISKSLIRRTGQRKEEDIEMSIFNFCLINQDSIDVQEMLNKLYKERYAVYKKDKPKDKYSDSRVYRDVTNVFDGAMEITLENFDFKFNAEKINIKKNFKENFIHLKMLELKLKDKKKVDISGETAQYVVNLFKSKKENDPMEEIVGIASFLDKDTLVKYLKKYIDYKELNEVLENKDGTKVKKAKI